MLEKDIVYHKYNDDRTSYECVPCYNSVDEYIASEKEDLESYNPYQSSFTADTGTYRLCADKVVCKRVYEVERILLNWHPRNGVLYLIIFSQKLYW